PTPTPISPLSLHDALPICRLARARSAHDGDEFAGVDREVDAVQHLHLELGVLVDLGDAAQLDERCAWFFENQGRTTFFFRGCLLDRKSTRLNSSHVAISYA